ncbi:MAG: G1 family endopeptidase [Candidatus Babeliales bacterium]|nr:G1 family endopeptidase [Candidatus Babeliales bacterium]
MKSCFFKQGFLLSVVCTALSIQGLEIPADFKQIPCDIVPRIHHQIEAIDNRFTHPHIPLREGTSTNWAGYVSVTNLHTPAPYSVTSVSGSWIVPALSKSTGTTYCSMWVGIDGYTSGSVEQLGTEHDWVNGKQQNTAWFEMYPQYPYNITGFPVNVGDSISASVVYLGNNVFVLTMTNNTRKVYFAVPTSYTKSTTAQRSCAEWIMEAPFATSVLPLSHFGTVHFSNCLAKINGISGAINNSKWVYDPLTMVTSSNVPKATLSGLTNNGKDFTVTWKHE